ncbi:uncharacterized protein LOC124458406 [Xenia sp. Carnegie-2017]|uniref:uncharacterized protein LOC124458406 n=1 Tax=Xenia sp. Carnegie-2017 TaxID=2897299 RepID=UPI001F037573|nr:uncharacterized protein LOC124458406 [Xenia sp. Carnegie-2017]
MCKHKEDLCKAYSRITLYLCPVGPLKESSGSELPISEYFQSEYEVEDEYLVYDENNEGLQPSDVQLGAVQIEDDHDVIQSFSVEDFMPMGFDENKAVKEAIRKSLYQHECSDSGQHVENSNEEKQNLDHKTLMHHIIEHAKAEVTGELRQIVISRLNIWGTTEPYFRRKGF